MKKTLTMLALMLPMLAFAQWRVGVNGGADLNHFIIDKQYLNKYLTDLAKQLDANELHIEHRTFFTIESEKMIVSALNKFLGI